MYISFGTIRNNTALKHIDLIISKRLCFGTIRNNTALKQLLVALVEDVVLEPFETTQL